LNFINCNLTFCIRRVKKVKLQFTKFNCNLTFFYTFYAEGQITIELYKLQLNLLDFAALNVSYFERKIKRKRQRERERESRN
jgi:hypothetical protein